jgi:hypothetical protein
MRFFLLPPLLGQVLPILRLGGNSDLVDEFDEM